MEIEQVRHESHDHALTFYEESEEKLNKIAKLSEEEIRAPLCYGCFETIHGPAYLCDFCGDFWLHKACFELPSELSKHSLHSADHPLTLIVRPPSLAGFFVCDGCRDMSPGFAFHCRVCRFNLDVKCALSTDGEDLRSRKGVKNTEIPYFGDDHKLVSFKAKQEVGKTCTGCQLLLSGPSYGCLECEFYLHESCKDMPPEIKHPYHLHPLRAQVAEYGSECDACHMPIRKIFYRCSQCDFNLHILCANKSLQVASSLKHKCHEHDLYYFVASHFYEFSLCNTCRKVCKSSYYVCLKCRYYVHLDCIPLPRVVENDSHSRENSHSLTLKDCFFEDDKGQYFCNVCEKERNPTYDVYHCDQCPNSNTHVAHIECLMSELMEAELRTSAKMVEDASMVKIRKQSEGDEKGETKCLAIVKYTDPENKTKDKSGLLPTMTHCLHPQHTLTKFQPGGFKYFICDGCRDLCHRVAGYHCDDCHFFLDKKCASLPDDQCEKLKKRESKTIDFCHKHELTRANCAEVIEEKCKVCQFPISGATYCCINCSFFLHESCVETPQKIQHPYHLQDHPLLGRDLDGNPKTCRACNLQIWNLAYYCGICDFALHFTCAVYLTSTLKHEFHEHTLFSFVAWDLGDQGFIQSLEAQPSKGKFRCEDCGKDCRYSFYRCVECNINRHLHCISLPLKVQQKDHHYDPLSLMEKVIEDGSGVYYCDIFEKKRNDHHFDPLSLMDEVIKDRFEVNCCDICEKTRNRNHPVYCCKTCEKNPFIAHIGCVLKEGDPLLKILAEGNKDSGSETGGSKVDDGTSLASHSELESYAMREQNTEGPWNY